MSDKDFRMVPMPELASDTLIEKMTELFGSDLKLAEATAKAQGRIEELMRPALNPEPTSVAETLFHTTKRHRPDIYECKNCGYQFPWEATCPTCNSTGISLFMRAPSREEVRQHTRDRESVLTELDPEWRWRFNDDEDRAWEFYNPPPRTRLVGLGQSDQPPEEIKEPYVDPDEDIDFDKDLEPQP